MDWQGAWNKIAEGAKSTRQESATNGRAALDSVSLSLAPLAARWDAEADRRAKLRTPENLKKLMDAQRAHNSARSTVATARSQRRSARAATKNPLAASRRAARTADRAAGKAAQSAKGALREARTNYPATLASLVARIHAAHATAAGLASWALTEHAHSLTLWPAEVSAATIAAQVGALYLGRRKVEVQVEDGLTAEERRLAQRLDPSWWVENAPGRGLAGTLTTPAELTESGLVSHVRLDSMTPGEFKAKADQVRALLGVRTDLRMEIKAGTHGDRARIVLRTRSAADGVDLSGWVPGAPWGVDTITGEPVTVPLGRRMLVAGASGSGKSWSTRALLGEASERADHRLVVFDRKRVEALNWRHRARTAVEPVEMLAASDELVAEMFERLEEIPRGRDVIAISPSRPRITVFVDEGAELIAVAATKGFDRLLENLRSLARMGRAAEIILIWATQKPTMSGPGCGIDSQIAAQITVRAGLYLATATESMTVFGPDAIDKGWHAHELPESGHALLRVGAKGRPHPIKTRAFSPADVIALPARPIWRRDVDEDQAAPRLTLVKDTTAPAPAASVPVQRSEVETAVLDAVRKAGGPARQKELVEATGLAKGTVSKVVTRLVDAGALVRAEDGSLTVAAGEVSA